MLAQKQFLTAILSTMLFSGFVVNANAGEIVKCEKRNVPARSRVSAQFEGLTPGAVFSTTVSSGANTVTSHAIPADVGGVVEFDFDSNQRDILAGATPIATNFIVSTTVSVVLKNALGATIDSATGACKIR